MEVAGNDVGLFAGKLLLPLVLHSNLLIELPTIIVLRHLCRFVQRITLLMLFSIAQLILLGTIYLLLNKD